MSVVISGARKVDADGLVEDRWLLIDGESIAAMGTGAPPAADERIDAQGDWLAPRFIDLHGHGGGGHCFDEGAEWGGPCAGANRAGHEGNAKCSSWDRVYAQGPLPLEER